MQSAAAAADAALAQASSPDASAQSSIEKALRFEEFIFAKLETIRAKSNVMDCAVDQIVNRIMDQIAYSIMD